MKTKILCGLLTLVLASSAGLSSIEVLSGGRTDLTSSYRATWTYKPGWLENGGVLYDPQSSDSYRFEWNVSLTVANARWSSAGLATQTLNQDYDYTWCTADFYDVEEFDAIW
jgi:hypothetical protein